MFPVQRLIKLVCPFCLEPVNVSRMVGLFGKAPSRVAIKNRASEGGAFNRVAVATAGDVPASEHELELSASRFTEEGNGATVETSVLLDLLVHEFGIFLAVKPKEYFFDHRLLILGKEIAQLGFHDLPVVVDLRAERVVKGEAKLFTLLFREALVKGLDKGFGTRWLLRLAE